MSQRMLRGAIHPHLATPMRGRDPAEEGRASTPLELFFDLVVVAVALGPIGSTMRSSRASASPRS